MQNLIICAGKSEDFKFAKSVGVGLVEAAINLTKICLEKKPEKLVFIGSCGLYRDGKMLKIYESTHAFNIEASKLTHNFYSPAECEVNLGVSHETKICNSSNFICTDEKVAVKFANLGFFMENMEAFSVLNIAKKFGIEAVCFLCASNFCDKFAHETFIKNHTKVKQNLERFLQEKNLI